MHVNESELSLARFSIFSFFFCAFASPPLLPVIRESLNLTSVDISLAALSSASGTIFGRLLMGPTSDLLGPRTASAAFCFLSAPLIFFLAANSTSPLSFLLLRFFSGLSLASLICTQYKRCSVYVSTCWANIGYAATQLIMPFIYNYYVHYHGLSPNTAWRAAIFIPTALQVWTMLVLITFENDDCEEQENGTKLEQNNMVSNNQNYNGVWMVGVSYGSCCGVEIVMLNIVAELFYDVYGFGLRSAGAVAAGYGVVSVAARLGGGALSKNFGVWFGVRGRLWMLWIVQCLGGLLFLGMWGAMRNFAGGIALVVGVAVFVQGTAGMIIEMVHFLSHSGAHSGITGSIGVFWAVTTQITFSIGSHYSIEVGTFCMGVAILLYAFPIMIIYIRGWGGMFRAPVSDSFEFDEEYQLLR